MNSKEIDVLAAAVTKTFQEVTDAINSIMKSISVMTAPMTQLVQMFDGRIPLVRIADPEVLLCTHSTCGKSAEFFFVEYDVFILPRCYEHRKDGYNAIARRITIDELKVMQVMAA